MRLTNRIAERNPRRTTKHRAIRLAKLDIVFTGLALAWEPHAQARRELLRQANRAATVLTNFKIPPLYWVQENEDDGCR